MKELAVILNQEQTVKMLLKPKKMQHHALPLPLTCMMNPTRTQIPVLQIKQRNASFVIIEPPELHM